jgi:hypothetical protein
MSLIAGPERYSAPPVETWMMPSEAASAKPCRAAFSVWELDTLMAGNAKAPALAASSISAYFSGVAMGTGVSSVSRQPAFQTLVATVGSLPGRTRTTDRATAP